MARRLPVFAACGLLAAAVASAASAGTQLLVSGPTATAASGVTSLEVKGAPGDTAWARVTTYVPSGYTINLGQPAGTRIGSTSAQALLLESGSVVGGTGGVFAADRNDPALQQAATRCTGTASHSGIWIVRLTLSTQALDVAVYVDPAAGTDAAFGGATLVFCLPQPYARGLATYAPLGTKLNDLKTTLSAGVLRNPLSAGSHVWRTVLMPWAAAGSAPDLAATIETQGLVGVPSSLSLRGKVETTRRRGRVSNSVLLSGKLLENLRGVAGATVSFFASERSAGGTTTRVTGTFARRIRLAQRTTFTATATVPTRVAPCVDPLPRTLAPAGCVAATRAGYRLRSNSVVVSPGMR